MQINLVSNGVVIKNMMVSSGSVEEAKTAFGLQGTWVEGAASVGDTYENGMFIRKPPAVSLETLKSLKHAEINAALENAAQTLVGDYPQAERDTWRIQQAELERWQDDPNAITPWVSLMAGARGISRDDLMVAIADNVQAFYAASAVLVGVRQRLRDEVDAAATADDVQAIQWPADPFA